MSKCLILRVKSSPGARPCVGKGMRYACMCACMHVCSTSSALIGFAASHGKPYNYDHDHVVLWILLSYWTHGSCLPLAAASKLPARRKVSTSTSLSSTYSIAVKSAAAMVALCSARISGFRGSPRPQDLPRTGAYFHKIQCRARSRGLKRRLSTPIIFEIYLKFMWMLHRCQCTMACMRHQSVCY